MPRKIYLIILFSITGISLLAQKTSVGEKTYSISNEPFSFVFRTMVMQDYIFVSNFYRNDLFRNLPSESYILKLDTSLQILDTLSASELGCPNPDCFIDVMGTRTDSTFWIRLDNWIQPIYKDNRSLLLTVDGSFNIKDTLIPSFSNLRSSPVDIKNSNDSLMVVTYNGFPSYSLFRKSDYSLVNDTLLARPPFGMEILKEPLFYNNHWYLTGNWNDAALRVYEISKNGHLDTVITHQGSLAVPLHTALRILPGSSPNSLKFITLGSTGNGDSSQLELHNYNLNTYQFSLAKSFPLNMPPRRVQGINRRTSFPEAELTSSNVDWVNLSDIYIGIGRGEIFDSREFKPGDTTLKRFIHLYKIDSAGNVDWYRRLGDSSFYGFSHITAHENGVYIVGTKYNWKNPPSDHVTDGFIMSVNEKGEVIGMREMRLPVQQLSVYPNPAHKQFTLQGLPSKFHSFQYRIHNTAGQIMQQGKTRGNITLKDLTPGTYWVILTNSKSQWQGSSKIVVK